MRELINTLKALILKKWVKPVIHQEVINMPADFNAAAKPYRETRRYQQNSNCYTYALGIPQHGKATPGALLHNDGRAGVRIDDHALKLQPIYNALVKDGLKPIPRPENAPYENAPIIAAFLSINDDYHFYRRHQDGTWSHQKGYRGAISDRDGLNAVIEDPLYAERGRYKDFIGYFTLPQQGLRYTVPKW